VGVHKNCWGLGSLNLLGLGQPHLGQVLARVEQAFAKIETAISRQVVVSPATTASSPPPPTPPLEHGKILNSTKIAQLHKESVSTKNKEVDIKNKNHQVSKLEDHFMLATKYDNVQIGDDVLNLSTTHAIIEQHLVDTKSEFSLS
jgi:hypothetical protein